MLKGQMKYSYLTIPSRNLHRSTGTVKYGVQEGMLYLALLFAQELGRKTHHGLTWNAPMIDDFY